MFTKEIKIVKNLIDSIKASVILNDQKIDMKLRATKAR